MKQPIVSIVVLMLSVLAAHAQAKQSEVSTLTGPHSLISMEATGEQLEAACSSESSIILTSCFAYIHGALDGIDTGIIQETKHRTSVVPKIPDGVDNGELSRVVTAYIQKHPEQLHFNAGQLIFWALTEAWGTTTLALTK